MKHSEKVFIVMLIPHDQARLRLLSTGRCLLIGSDNTSAFHRTKVEFGKHWSLSALA